jgi:hypothetical protein
MEENFSPQESLQLIQSMISKTKTNIGENRFYFLLWGWYTFFAFLGQFFLKTVLRYEQHYVVWWLTIPVVVITVLYSSKKNRRKGARTYIGESMGNLWMGIGISFFVLSFIISSNKEGWSFSSPLFILFYGLGTFVSGRLLKFRPLIIGGIINWGLACASAYVSFDYQLLCGAAAILTSYIIPGYLLGSKKN